VESNTETERSLMLKAILVLSIVAWMFAMPLALLSIIFDGIKDSDPDIEID